MEALAAVVTTGIYCRPGCSARPRSQNVRRFPLAAAAEAAGYRACLRCRPYRTPQPVSGASPELVCRAVGLILDGALDDGTEAELGQRLGVSGRHLRRLFTTHLGVTPDGLARSARAHFARRLLDDTDLSITEIAFLSGFGSLRQFNRTCRDIFRAPPRTLRAKRRKADRLVADGGLVLRLPYSGALDWEAMTRFLAARALPGVEHVADGTYSRTISVNGNPGVLELTDGEADHLILRAHLPHWEELIHLVSRARRIASLDLDLDEPVRQLRGDPVIGELVRARPGLRPPGTWDAFETGVRAIIGQGTTLGAANTLAARLVQRLGTPVPGLGQMGLTHTFPAPETVAVADLTDLAGLGLTRVKAAAIGAFARAVADGTIPLDRSLGLDQLVAAICDIRGLGQWTAHYLALRLGEPDAFPMTDLAVRRALAAHLDGPGAAVPAVANRWRPWRAVAVTHLWAEDGRADRRTEHVGAA